MRGYKLMPVPLLAVSLAWAGPVNIQFPADYRSEHLLYTEVDREDDQTVRHLFANQAAAEAAQSGRPLPSGAVLTMEIYKAQRDPQGELQVDESGRYQQGALAAIVVMEKRTGWGKGYDPGLRNGEWEYAKFTADGKLAEGNDAAPCLKCHLSQKEQGYVFTLKELAASGP